MLRKLCRLSEISPREWPLLFQLLFFSLALRTGLVLVTLPRLLCFLSTCAKTTLLRQLPALHQSYNQVRLTTLADLASRAASKRGRCLIRSLLLLWLLTVRGEPAELVIGISKQTSALDSHAWIESRGTILVDGADGVGQFAALVRFSIR